MTQQQKSFFSSDTFKWLLRFLGPLILVVILWRYDLSGAIEILKQIKIHHFLIAVVLFFPRHFFRALRWQKILDRMGFKASSIRLFNLNVSSYIIGSLTPGRLGGIVKILPLRADGCPFNISLTSVLIDRIVDLFLIFSLGFWGLSTFFAWGFDIAQLGAVAAVLLIIGGLVFLNLNLLKRLFDFDKLQNAIEAIKRLKGAGPLFWITALLYSLFSWLCIYMAIWILNMSLGIDLTFLQILLIFSISGSINIFPISIAGMGTRDMILLIIFPLLGRDSSQALALSFSVLSMMIAFNMISTAWWLVTPIKSSNNNSPI